VNTGTAALLIRVQDVEDQPPEFVSVPPVTRVSEDISINSAILRGILEEKIYNFKYSLILCN
jgi:cadherin 23